MRSKIITCFFCLLLAGGVLSGLLIPDKYYSESEKRILTRKEAVSGADFLDGEMGRQLEKYLADQFPLRDSWISLKTLTERFSGKTEIAGVYFGRDGYLIDSFTEYDEALFQANLEALERLGESIEVPMDVMLIPTVAQILSDKLPSFAPNCDQRALLDEAEAHGLNTIEVFSILSEHKDEYIYYRTDHHFTSLGAYYCYAQWKKAQGQIPEPVTAWESQILCDDFRGTTYAKVNAPFAASDSITAYFKNGSHTVNYNNGGYVTDSIYERKYLSGKDQYAVFLNSNQAVTVVSGGGEGRLLILKDSYANCFAQFVIDDYAETHLLVLYNIPNFAADTAITGALR